MIKYENECVGCHREIGCLGSGCPYQNVSHYYCDKCGDETTLYRFNGEELCIDCIKNSLEKVTE